MCSFHFHFFFLFFDLTPRRKSTWCFSEHVHQTNKSQEQWDKVPHDRYKKSSSSLYNLCVLVFSLNHLESLTLLKAKEHTDFFEWKLFHCNSICWWTQLITSWQGVTEKKMQKVLQVSTPSWNAVHKWKWCFEWSSRNTYKCICRKTTVFLLSGWVNSYLTRLFVDHVMNF